MFKFTLITIFFSLSNLVIGQDMCSGATDIGIIGCGADETGNGDSSSTPDTEAAGLCLDGINSIWYQFTVDPAVISIDISGTDFILFEGSCGALTDLLDCSGSTNQSVDASTTYYVLVGETGGFGITTISSVSSDLCADATDVTGGSTGEDNFCSTDDDGMCSSQGESSVWFSYNLADPVTSLSITVESVSITDPAVGLYSDCSTQIIENCNGELSTGCLPAGTYYIQVSSEAANQGTFDLVFTEIDVIDESDCNQATPIAVTATCIFETFSGDSNGACPEVSDYGSGCSFTSSETVWFEYTTMSGSSSIDIDNLSSNLELSIFDGPCGNSLSGCITSATNFPITGGTTYYIAATLTSGGGTFDFDIRENESPPNNDCADATDLQSGFDQSTCCANGGNGCGDAGVWFTYPFPDGNGTIFDLSNISITGDVGIDIYEGDCNGFLVFSDCGGGPFSYESPHCDVDVFTIHVTSDADGCGDFNLTATPVVACTFSDDCGGGPELAPVTNGAADCADGCTQFSCYGGCFFNGVWFTVNTDDLATAMQIIVNAPSDFQPIVTVFQLDCDISNVLVGCAQIASGEILDIAVSGNITYLIEVASEGVDQDFELCVITTESTSACASTTLGSIDRADYPDENEEGPYCPGETVTFCFDIDFTVDPIGEGNNCQWLQGIIPTIGGGWDLSENPINGAMDGPGGGWDWLDEGLVEYGPYSSFSHPTYEVITTSNGDLGLQYGAGGLTAGDVLPAGWWFVSDGNGPNCANDGSPNTMWGLPEGCGGSTSQEVCFDLTVRELDDIGQCSDPDFIDLSVTLFTFADGQTGCWSNNTCAQDQPAIFTAEMDCSSLIEVVAEDVEICNDAMLDLLLETSDGSPADIFVTVLDEGNTSGAQDHVFSNGEGSINDVITNEGTDTEIVIYEAYALLPPSVCEGPKIEIQVIVYPPIEIEVEEPYYICFMHTQDIQPIVSGGGGGPFNYEWEDGSSDPSLELPLDIDQLPGEYEIQLTVSDNVLGCTETAIIEYIILEPLFPEVEVSAEAACINGIDDNVLVTLTHQDPGTDPYEYTWSSNPPGLEFRDGPDDNSVIIDDEESRARTYTILATVADDFGCEYTAETTFTVDNGPDLIFEVDDCIGSEYLLTGYTLAGDQVTYELYYSPDGDYDFSDNTINNADFLDSSFGTEYNYVATLSGTYILLGISENGCADFAFLDINTVAPEFSVLPGNTICNEQSVTIAITNASVYSDINWSTGSDESMITVSPSDTITYYVELITADDCTILDSIEINVNALPDVNISGSASFCPGTSTTLTVDGPANYSYLWTGPGGEMITTQSAMISSAGSWQVLVITDNGCQDSETIDVSEETELRPQITGDDICTGDMVVLDGGPGFDSYEWTDGSNTVIGTMQRLEVTQGGTYTLDVVLGSCPGNNSYTVQEFMPLMNALSGLEGIVCNDDTGTLPTDINLTMFETGVSGMWLDENDFQVADPTSVDFTGENPGTLVYSFVTTEAVAPCENETYNFNIDISDCACPDVRINQAPDICIGDNSFDLSLIQETSEPGSWTVDPNTTISIINGTDLVSDDNTEPGVYTLTFTLDQTVDPSCDQSNSVTFTVSEELNAELDLTASVCNADSGSDPDFIDLDDLYISGIEGTWSTNETGVSIDADNVVFFTGLDEGVYVFLYFIEDVNSSCDPRTIQVPVRVRDCSCPNVSTTDIPDQCNDGSTISLISYLTNPDNLSGTWSVEPSSAQANIIGGNRFDINGLDEGNYTFTFTLSDSYAPSCDIAFTTDVDVFAPPSLTFTEKAFVCNGTTVTVYPVDLDLTTLVSEAGVWTDPSGNEIVDPTNLDFTDEVPGEYTYSFVTQSATAPCVDEMVDVIIEVVNCNCPPIIFIPIDPQCNDGGVFDLNVLLESFVEPGTWSFISGPNDITLSGSTFDLDFLDGQYNFQYTLDNIPTGCQGFSQISVTVLPSIDMEGSGVEYCEGESDMIMLESLIDGYQAGGEWTELSNSTGGAFDSALATFIIDDQRADQYRFQYELPASASCDGQMVVAEVLLNDLPIADAGDDFNIDCDTEEIVLGSNLTSTGGDISYEWSELSGLVTQNNNDSNYTASQSGVYTLTVTDDLTGCSAEDEVEVFSNTDVPSYIADISEPNCSDPDAGAIIVTGVNGGAGQYLYSIDGGMTFVDDPQFMNLTPGTYNLIIQDANGCETPPQQIVIVEPDDLKVDAGEDQILELTDEEYNLQIATSGDPDSIVSVVWTEDGVIICDDNPTDCASIMVNPVGQAEYCVTVIDVFGCIAEDCVTLSERRVRDIYIANIFTPDGTDVDNNKFFVQSDDFIESVDEFRIYDRWGEMVFSAPAHLPNTPESGWDGFFNDKPVEQGVYVYVIKIRFAGPEQETEIISGNVTVIR